VGELVYLYFTGGGASWTATAGSLEINPPETGQWNNWTAPASAGSVTITAQGEHSSATITFTVVEPSDIKMMPSQGYDLKHHYNEADLGERTDIYFMPDDVNFYAVVWRERDCPRIIDGGVYLYVPGVGHQPNPNPIQCSTIVKEGWGTYAGYDRIYSGRPVNPPVPYQPSNMYLDIPWRFKTVDGLLWSQFKFSPVRQTHTLAKDGTSLFVRKAICAGQLQVSSPTSGLNW
jgi:hypothetical protein